MTVKNLYTSVQDNLKAHYSVSEAEILSFWILEHFYKLSKTDYILDKPICEANLPSIDLQNILYRLSLHQPMQYIIGEAIFCDNIFSVNASTLIPRPETEQLVQNILHDFVGKTPFSVLDIGTGSGCIAISLALAWEDRKVEGIDISHRAIETAQYNAQNLGAKVDFRVIDVLNWAVPINQKWDLMVSNPPYVRESEKNTMATNVIDYEPHQALFVEDEDALLFYRVIAEIASKHLTEHGFLYVEINEVLGDETTKLLQKKGFVEVEIIKDLEGKNRFVKAKKNK